MKTLLPKNLRNCLGMTAAMVKKKAYEGQSLCMIFNRNSLPGPLSVAFLIMGVVVSNLHEYQN